MGRLGKGWKPTPHHVRPLLAAPRSEMFATGDLPEVIDLPLPDPLDQGATSSCVAHSTVVALCAAMAKAMRLPAGQFPELPSRRFAYYYSRAATGDLWYPAASGADPAPKDEGTFIHAAFDVYAELGFPKESAWPWDPSPLTINTRPDQWEHLRLAADQKVALGISPDQPLRSYRLRSGGRARVDEVERLLANGHYVVWGTQLDQAFEDMTPTQVWQGVLGEDLGGHAMVLHRRQRYGLAKRRKFGTRSSWGWWCDGGTAWVDEDAIASENAQDFFAVELAPAYSGTT